MKNFFFSFCALCALAFAMPATGRAEQPSLYESFHSHNAEMLRYQPAWIGPVISGDPRLGQGVKFSVGNIAWSGGHTLDYGNDKGLTLVLPTRWQFQFDAPSYFRNHSRQIGDGWGNADMQAKFRLASAPSGHGGYIVSAALMGVFSPRAQQNMAASGAVIPKLLAGKQWGRFDVQGQIAGVLPTAKTGLQGRVIEWSVTGQVRTVGRLWAAVEDNAAHFRGGGLDGRMQNFVTPELAYQIRRRDWAPTHTVYILTCGMQIKSSDFALYNHNLVTEMRVMF